METSPQLSDTWEVYPQLTAEKFQAGKAANIDPILMQLLANRGIHEVEAMRTFLNADYKQVLEPLTLIDMEKAVSRIQTALDKGEHITVYGDFDADGVTSSALLYRALHTLKKPEATLDFHIPHRLKDGCGLNEGSVETLKKRGTQLIITTDCASSDVAQVVDANGKGIDVIITDHHQPPAEIPPALAMVNPWRPECTYGERFLCGVGIAFKLAQALFRAYKRSEEDELELLDLVAIGTIADIAPLLGENHTFVRLGLQRLNQTRKPGLQALIRNANLQPGKIRERDIAFGLAPRINAAGRMKEAAIAFNLMITNDPEEATALANELETLNIARQQQTEALMNEVRKQAAQQPLASVVLVNGDDWHEGIIGLVAGKLSEEIQKPVLVLSNDPEKKLSRGSARSQKGFDIIAALRTFASQLERYGGHAQAAGFTIRTERIEALRAHLLQWHRDGGPPPDALIAGSNLPDPTGIVTEQESSETAPTLMPKMVDLVMTHLDLLTYTTYKLLRQLSPFGAVNPEPVFKIKNLQLHSTWTSGPNRQNLRLRFNNVRATATYTRGAYIQDKLKNVSHVDIIFRIDSAEDDARPDIWLKILDVQPSTHALQSPPDTSK